MTPEERAARREAKRANEAARREQERADKRLAAEAMRAIMKNPDSSPEQLIFALEVLDNLEYYSLIPYNSFTRAQTDEATDDRRRAFMEEFAARHPEIMKEIEAAREHE